MSVAVLEEQRGNGFGKILVNEAFKGVKEKQCDEMYLCLLYTSDAADE